METTTIKKNAQHREIARWFRTVYAMPEHLDTIASFGDLTTEQRNSIAEAHNLTGKLIRALGCICISEVAIRSYGAVWGVEACGVQIVNDLGLDGALECVRHITGRNRGAVKTITNDRVGVTSTSMTDIRPRTYA
jgi:hypothetical protein